MIIIKIISILFIVVILSFCLFCTLMGFIYLFMETKDNNETNENEIKE